MLIREYKTYKHGLIDSIESHSIPHGAASRVLNWHTKGDKIELARGRYLKGTEDTTAGGRVSGLHVGFKADGTEVLFKTKGRKVYFFDESLATPDWVEISTNIIPTAADGEDISFSNYNSLAGAQTWFGSPNSGLWKIMTANPSSVTDMYDANKNYKAYLKIKQNRMFAWQRPADPSGIYMSYIDAGAYTTVSGEATTSLGGTLAFKAAGPTRTCFGIAITLTGTGEVYTDDYNGVLTGSLGGTGTINYTSGVYTLSNAGVGTASYQWENSNNTGIGDFTYSGTRTAGQGDVIRQDDGGKTMTVESLGDTEFCIHEKKTWELTLTADDTNATNLIFRERVGIPNLRAAVSTGSGIYYIDDTDESRPYLRVMTFERGSDRVVPVTISFNIDLEDFRFDTAACAEWNEYVLFACRTSDSTVNNRIIVYNKIWKSLEYLGYYASCFAIYNGVLLIGDSLSNNVYEIFSGLDDDGSTIDNYWEGALSDLEIDQLKKYKRLILEGEIGPDQQIDVYLSYDNSAYSLLGSILGSGAYVDRTQSVDVGAVTVGRTEIGGGGLQGSIPAYHYMREFTVSSTRFHRVKIKFVASELGYASVTQERYKDIRLKGYRIPSKYRTAS